MNDELYQLAKKYLSLLDPKRIVDIEVRQTTGDIDENNERENHISIDVYYKDFSIDVYYKD